MAANIITINIIACQLVRITVLLKLAKKGTKCVGDGNTVTYMFHGFDIFFIFMYPIPS